MHCPACSSPAAEQQKYCRACGMNLDGLAERVALHQGTMSAANSRFDSFFIRLGTLMAIGGGGMLMLLVFLAIINEVFGFFINTSIDDIATKVAVAIGLPLLFFGIGFVALPHLLRLWKPNRPLSP